MITCGQRPPLICQVSLRDHLWTETTFAMSGHPPSSPMDRDHLCYVRSPSVITCGQRQPPSSSVDRDSLHHHLWTETASIIISGQRQPPSSPVDKDHTLGHLHYHLWTETSPVIICYNMLSHPCQLVLHHHGTTHRHHPWREKSIT